MGRCALLSAAIASAQTGSTQAPPIDVHQLLTEANAAASGIDNSFQRGLVLDRVGAAVASTGDLESAAGISERAYPNNMSSLTAIGRQFAKSGNLSKAHAITDHLPGGGGSTVLAFMAKGQAQHGGIQRAVAIAGEIKAPEVRSYALKEIAQEQAAAGDYAGARKTIKAANSAYPAQQSSASDIESTIAEAQIKRGEINAAHATIRSLGQPDAPLAMLDGSQLLLESGNTAAAHDWLEEAISNRWNSEGTHFLEYMAIPMEIKLGLKERAFSSANVMGAKGYVAVAITCIETGDLGCAHDALVKMQDSPTQKGEDEHMSAFEKQLDVLNVAAALIDHNALDEAEGLLNSTESSLDSLSKISILPQLQSDRAVLLAKRKRYAEARIQALRVRREEVSNKERGDALRILASLETKVNGPKAVHDWAISLSSAEDRAYVLIGILEAVLGTDDVKLPYNALQIH